MNNKKIMFGALGLAVLGSAVYASGVFADQRTAGKFGPNYTPERHEQMQKAFENNDYAAWKSQMGDRGATRVVNEQNFSRFSEMHKLMLEGKTEEANKIRAELGLGQRNGQGQGRGMHGGQQGQNRGENFVDKNGDGACDNMR